MKVRICYTVHVSDRYRRAINNHYWASGLATRDDVKAWIAMYGSSCDHEIEYELQCRDDERA